MKRYVVLLLAITIAFGLVGSWHTSPEPASAQDAPEGTWFGTWPYVLAPEHHLNAFASGGLNTNLGVVYRSFVELPAAYYMWADNEYIPLLGAEWGFTEDGTGYTLTLRDDATWSNGSPVSADDVMATYNIGRILEWSQFNYIADFEKVDDHTVLFTFIDQPSLLAERLILKEYISPAEIYGELAAQAAEVYASGAEPGDDSWEEVRNAIQEFRPDVLLATGPYTYSLEDVGDSYMTLRWQPNSVFSDMVNFGELRLWAGETEATTPLVLSGELAHSTNVYPPATQQAFANEGIRLITLSRGYGPAVLFNHDFYPFNVTEVRQAMALIIDREENAFLTNGLGATGTEYMAGLLDDAVPVWINQETIEQLDRYARDLDRAAGLLETAGFTRDSEGFWADADGNRITAEYKFPAEFADFSAAALNVTDQLNNFGFDITARPIPWQQCAEDIRNGDFELSVWSWASASPFPARQFFGPVQRFNYVGLSEGQRGMNFNMEFEWQGEMINLDEMINSTSDGLDVEAQIERSSEVALIINTLMPYIPLNEILSVEPFNEDLISGGPSDDDPILANPSGSGDHFIIYYILTGVLGPR